MKLGFIGLGVMGRPMALHLQRAGHELAVWARRPASASDLPARVSATPAELGRCCEVVFTVITSSADVEGVALGKDGLSEGMARGSVLIDCSTIAPESARHVAACLAEKGIDMLDAPVSGGVQGAIDATLAIMIGFGHASPMTKLVNADGGTTDGRQLLGKKRLILFWDYATREEQAQAANMMQVLQLSQADLIAAGVEIMFTQIRFPGNSTGETDDNGNPIPRQAPMNDTALRQYQVTYGVKGKPQLPMYRFPNAVEYNAARELGLEGASTYIQYLRASPAIILLDEGGIVRWHSESIQPAPAGDTTFAGKDDQYTIVQAIEFPKKQL